MSRNWKRNGCVAFSIIFFTVYSTVFFDQSASGNQEKVPTEEPNIDPDAWTCAQLFEGNRNALQSAKLWTPKENISDGWILQNFANNNCQQLLRTFHFPTAPLTPEEADYPIAFVLIVHRNAFQFIRLLQAIFWPQNIYCITYDNRTDLEFKNAITKLVDCLPDNVFLSRTNVDIHWGHYSVLRAAMGCLESLDKSEHEWHYVQTLSWSDFPLKTNREMVEIFKILNGSNDAELNRANPERYRNPALFIPNETDFDLKVLPSDSLEIKKVFNGRWVVNKSETKTKPPNGLALYKGSFQTSLSRDFVNFLFSSAVARQFQSWTRDTFIPDELYLQSLIHNAQFSEIPGTFPGQCLKYYEARGLEKPWISRYDVWTVANCGGKIVRHSCVFGVDHLQKLKLQPHLVVHKLYLEYQPAAYYCLEELLTNRTSIGRDPTMSFDLNYYRLLPSVRYHNLSGEDKRDFKCWKLYKSDGTKQNNTIVIKAQQSEFAR